MRRPHSPFIVSFAAAASLLSGAACNNTIDGAKKDAKRASEQAATKTDRAAEHADELLTDAQRAAASASDRAAEFAERASETAAAAIRGVDVKATLMADPSIDATGIDMDADARTRTITLNGYVPSYAERDMAAIVAAAQAPGYRVQNRLAVR